MLLENGSSITNLFDWSRDGKFVLVGYFKTSEERADASRASLGILDAQALEEANGAIRIRPINLPDSALYDFWQARFSPSDYNKIIFMAERSASGSPNVFEFNIGTNQLLQLTNSTMSTVNSAVWLPARSSNGSPSIVYGEFDRRANDSATIGYNVWHISDSGQKINKIYQKSLLPNHEDINIFDASIDGSKLLLEDVGSQYPYFGVYNMTILNLNENDISQSTTVVSTHAAWIPRLNPSSSNADLVIFAIPSIDRDPGGPLELVSVDGGVHEILNTGETKVGDSPQSYVISPDGKTMLVTILTWSNGPVRLYKVELSHALPEFPNPGYELILGSVAIAIIVVIARKTTNRESTVL